MLAALRSLSDILLANLGHCAKCMRTSFAAAMAAWMIFVAAYVIAPSAIVMPAELIALSLSALWISHILVFAWKAVKWAPAAAKIDKRASENPSLSRRKFLPSFLRTLAIAAVMTASPGAIVSAFGQAQGPCDGCSRYRGSSTCWTCCSCQNSNCITGCKNTSGGNPDRYNTCIGNCSTTFGNCNRACQ